MNAKKFLNEGVFGGSFGRALAKEVALLVNDDASLNESQRKSLSGLLASLDISHFGSRLPDPKELAIMQIATFINSCHN